MRPLLINCDPLHVSAKVRGLAASRNANLIKLPKTCQCK